MNQTVETMRTLSDLPGPKGLPLLGNLLQLNFKQLHRILQRWCDEFGTLYRFQVGLRQVVAVADPELIQQILRNRPKLYRRLGTIEPVTKEMGVNGVFSAEGEDWKRQRRVIAHALDAGHLREFFPTLTKVTERLRNRWNRAADEHAQVNVQQDLMRYTVDVTTNLAFGYDMNTLEKEGDVIQQHLEKIFPMIDRRINAMFPYWRYFKLPADRALDKSLAVIRETIAQFIAQARERLTQAPELAAHPTNLLEAMLSAPDGGDAAFSDEEIHGNMLTMLLGGEDTTANTMAWMIHFMIEHPGTQERMRAEAAQAVSDTGMLSRLPDADRLNYIEALAHETMRLKPVAPLLSLEAVEDVAILRHGHSQGNRIDADYASRGIAGNTLRRRRPVPARTLARGRTNPRLRPQYKSVRAVRGWSAFLPGASTGHDGDQDRDGNAVHRLRSLQGRLCLAGQRDFCIYDDARESVRALASASSGMNFSDIRRKNSPSCACATSSERA